MREHLNNGEQEMLAAYGESLDAAPAVPSAEDELPLLREETIDDNPFSPEAIAEQYLGAHSPEDRASAEQIVVVIEQMYDKIGAEQAIVREKAVESLLGSAFAAAPASPVEQAALPLWKRVVGGATLGARNAVKAVALTATMAVPGVAQEYTHPSPEITKKVDYLFGTSILERLGTKRASFKKDYTELEVRKKEIQQRIREMSDARPRSTAEIAHIQRVEADRDAKLAALNVERTLETMTFESLHSKNPTDKAQYDANIAAIAAREARVIEDCEAQLLADHQKIAPPKELEKLHLEVIRIERIENELVRRFREMQRSSYGSGWTSWDGYK